MAYQNRMGSGGHSNLIKRAINKGNNHGGNVTGVASWICEKLGLRSDCDKLKKTL